MITDASQLNEEEQFDSVKALGAIYPSGCVVCGESRTTTRFVLFDKSVPFCTEHALAKDAEDAKNQMIQSKDFIAGIGFALAGMQRLFRQDSIVKEFCRDAGLDLVKFEQAGVSNYDLMVLEKSLREIQAPARQQGSRNR